jgi:hypothetical protein
LRLARTSLITCIWAFWIISEHCPLFLCCVMFVNSSIGNFVSPKPSTSSFK